MPYIRAIQRTPLGTLGGMHKRKNSVELASELASSLASNAVPDTFVLGIARGDGLPSNPARQVCRNCNFPSSANALTVLEGESAGFRALALCINMLEAGDGCALAIAAMSISALPYLLPDARRGCRLGESIAIDPLLAGDAPAPIGRRTDRHVEWHENAASETQKNHRLGNFKEEIHGFGGDEFLNDGQASRYAPNLSQISGTEHPMAPLAEGACGVLLERRPCNHALAQILSLQITPDIDGSGRAALKALHEASAFDPLQADRIEVVDPCATHPLHFMESAGLGQTDRINPKGGALAMGYVPGAAGLRALTALVHGLSPGQTGLCFQYGDGWSAGALVSRLKGFC